MAEKCIFDFKAKAVRNGKNYQSLNCKLFDMSAIFSAQSLFQFIFDHNLRSKDGHLKHKRISLGVGHIIPNTDAADITGENIFAFLLRSSVKGLNEIWLAWLLDSLSPEIHNQRSCVYFSKHHKSFHNYAICAINECTNIVFDVDLHSIGVVMEIYWGEILKVAAETLHSWFSNVIIMIKILQK